MLALIVGWQVWDYYEARRLAPEVTRLFPDGVQRRVTWPPQTNDASAYYAAVNVAAVSAGSVATLTDASDPQSSGRQLLARYRAALSAAEEPSSEDVSALTRFSSHYELPLRLVHDASGRTYTSGVNSVVQSSYRLSGMMAMRDALGAQTLELVRQKETEAAVESLISRAKLLRAYDPLQDVMAEYIKRTYVEDLAMDAAIVLSRVSPSEGLLARLDGALATAYDDDEIAKSIREQARSTYANLESFWSGRRVGTSSFVILERPILQHLTLEGLRTSREAIAAAGLPWPERLHAIDRLEDRRSPLLSWFLPGRRRLSLLPVADLASESAVRIASGMAFMRSVRLALGVERYRRSHGALPDDLAAVDVPANANLDPFSGKPFRYARDDGGYTIYSLGQNFSEDGGVLTGDPAKGQRPDRVPPRDIGIRVFLGRS
jgi:hypothetical protein